MFLAVSQINTSGSPIGNIKSYEISTVVNRSNSTNPSNPTNPSIQVGAVLDSTKTPALDSGGLVKDSSKSNWSSGTDGRIVDKGGVGEVLLKRSEPRNIFTNLEDSNLMAESNKFETSNEKITPELLGLAPGDMGRRIS